MEVEVVTAPGTNAVTKDEIEQRGYQNRSAGRGTVSGRSVHHSSGRYEGTSRSEQGRLSDATRNERAIYRALRFRNSEHAFCSYLVQ